MDCDHEAGEGSECVPCMFEDAREEGRREGYAACTADVVAYWRLHVKLMRAVGSEAMELRALAIEDEIAAMERGEHVGAAGKEKAVSEAQCHCSSCTRLSRLTAHEIAVLRAAADPRLHRCCDAEKVLGAAVDALLAAEPARESAKGDRRCR